MTNDQTLFFAKLKLFSTFEEALPYYRGLQVKMESEWLYHMSALALLKFALQLLPPWIVRLMIDDSCSKCSALFVNLNIDSVVKF